MSIDELDRLYGELEKLEATLESDNETTEIWKNTYQGALATVKQYIDYLMSK